MAHAQSMAESRYYAPLNSVAAFVEYSNSSSHIILGDDRQRKFAGLTLVYQREISASRWMAWDYSAELRPLLVESDPTYRGARITTTIGSSTYVRDERLSFQIPIMNTAEFRDGTVSGTLPDGTPFTSLIHSYLGRRWTYAPGITPVSFSVHLLPEHRLQTFLASSGGFIVSPRDIPEFKTSAFNFTFSFGGGVEWFRDHRRSWTVEYRVQHTSNKELGYNNPGIDSQFVRVGYRFGF
ncbi:MAG TPA: acyloxyacyl hydrolase [Acidobacteriaceae bacterium]